MKDRVLKTVKDFVKWKAENICSADHADPPERYPCLARTYVNSWSYEEETAEYLYREDIVALLEQFDRPPHTPHAPCPNDTDGDGNCGAPACPVCGQQGRAGVTR